ncbi:alpha/beta hydrolase domain-containing protein [Conexibacter sp. S30A1]|uniref:alpha/beta hydrolase domain-containing protein n=1 Tax=Conexibacter sp. S30A1 TaxID=2937800 RepID=UPI00200C6B4A|nr:alpha/beta hydrolase domain-containing protein [Conexibacter sp. S30A1]
MLSEVSAVPYASAAEVYCPFYLPDTTAATRFEQAGYLMEEYFLRGEGDLYASGGHAPRLLRSGLPFVTRALVARPQRPSDFSGVVHLNATHPFLGLVQWEYLAELCLDTGDAYIAVGTGTDALSRGRSTADYPVSATPVMRWFNSSRYAPLVWPEDDGIRWTIFADVAALLRAPERPMLSGLEIKRVYASGWSFLGSFMRTFINEGFHDSMRRADGGPLIDGYVIGISSPWQGGGYLEINSGVPPAPVGHQRRRLRAIDVPVIEFLSQNEGERNIGSQAPDVDEGPGRHRLYEVAGTTHTDLGVVVPRTGMIQLGQRSHPFALPEPPRRFASSDVPLRRLFSATMANLDRWTTESEAPPASARLRFDAALEVARDEFGNPLGGVRSVQLDLPLARYGRAPAEHAEDNATHFLPMYRIPLRREQLARLYPGGREEYLRRAGEVLERMISGRWLRRADMHSYSAEITDAAAAAFAVTERG